MNDEAVRVLQDIYKALQGTNQRLDETNNGLGRLEKQVDETNHRLDEANERLGRLEAQVDSLDEKFEQMNRRQTEAEMRVATELVNVSQLLRTKIVDQERFTNHERRISVLEVKAGVA